MKKNGQITVFLSMVLICMMSILLGLAESARIAGLKYRFQIALNASMSSIMSQYHRELWEEYQIFLLDQPEEKICEEMKTYMEAYGFETADIQYRSGIRAIDHGAQWIEEEIMDYMKYGIWTMEFDEEEVKEVWKGVSGAGELADAAERFSSCTKETLRLEKSVRELSDSIEKQNEYGQEVREGISIRSEEKIDRASEKYEKENKKIQKKIEEYEKTAAKMREKIEQAKKENEKRKERMEQDIVELVETEEERYDTYIAVDGERYQEIKKIGSSSQLNAEILQTVREYAFEAQEEEEDSEEEVSTTWQDVEQAMDGYETLKTILKRTEGEEEKADLLEKLKIWMEGDILTLLLGDETRISKGKILGDDLPSHHMSERTGKNGQGILSEIQWNAYIKEYFQDFGSVYAKEEQNVQTVDTERELQYETEYILAGNQSDRENLTESVKKILAVRTGLNLLYLYTDSEKRREADQLAMAIMGSSGLAPLAPVLTFFILSVWAMAEGVSDLKILLDGRKIPIWKSKTDWNLDLEGILDIAKTQTWANEDQDEDEEGAAYGTYLRLMLLFQDRVEKTYRVLDLMQNQIRKKEPEFTISDAYYYVEADARYQERHFFYGNTFLKDKIQIYAKSQSAY